jgi:hypothetical protein
MENNKYSINYGSEGKYWYDEGVFTITDNKIQLKPTGCYGHEKGPAIDCKESMGEGECKVEESNSSLYYSKFLICGSKINKNLLGFEKNEKISLTIEKYALKDGTERVINGVKVVIIKNKIGITSTNVKIRKMPSVKSESVEYVTDLYFNNPQTYSYVPEKSTVTIIARTKDKFNIEKWENYWYLINVGICSEVWMYGEFLKIK